MRRRFTFVLFVVAALSLSAVPVQAQPGDHAERNLLLAQVRQATAAYHDVAAAEAAGYEEASPCVPGMGYHYARGVAEAADELDPLNPEMLVYAPRPDGSLRLVAVEYALDGAVDAEDAVLFGESFAPPGPPGPPFYTLHAWVWQGNPLGTFSPYNPNISCD